MIERDRDILAAEIIGVCMKRALTVTEITQKIYKYTSVDSRRLPTIGRVFTIVEKLIEHGVLSPKCNNGQLRFQVNGGFFEKK